MPFGQRTAWKDKTPRTADSSPFIPWLRDRGSLTARLQARGRFEVRLLAQGLAQPTRDEALALGIATEQLAWVREVALYCDGAPLVFAHTVLPYRPRGPLKLWLSRLGIRSLGALLFAHARCRRGRLVCRRLDARHILYRRAIEATHRDGPPPPSLWARRSLFSFDTQNVLVTEVFSSRLKA